MGYPELIGYHPRPGPRRVELATAIKHATITFNEPMPVILRVRGYKFWFYEADLDEPPHVHVERDNCLAKFWLAPVRFQRNRGFKSSELQKIEDVIEQNQEQLMEKWDGFFNG